MFEFNNKYKTTFIVLIAIGLLALLAGIFFGEIEPGRIWANVLLNNLLFTAIALFGTFFIVIHTLGDSAWHLSVFKNFS